MVVGGSFQACWYGWVLDTESFSNVRENQVLITYDVSVRRNIDKELNIG